MAQNSDEETLGSEQQNDQRRQNDADGCESGKKGKQDPKPVGFWNKDLRAVRFSIFKKWAVTSM
jgi:hypothetical protein